MTITGLARGARIGDYILGPAIAAGADELVFDAAHVVLPRQARLVIAADPELGAVRLLRAACIVETLRHPAVPRVFECGRLADRRPWVARERVVGPSLGALVTARPLGPGEVIAMLRDVAGALELAHARGVLHGGLTADRVVRTDQGWVVDDWTTAAPGPLVLPADVAALGALAAFALAGGSQGDSPARPAVATGRLGSLIQRMLDPDPTARPSGVDVVAELAGLAIPEPARGAADDATPIEEEEVVLIDISRGPPPPPASRPARPRWTPDAAYQAPARDPSRGIARVPRKLT